MTSDLFSFKQRAGKARNYGHLTYDATLNGWVLADLTPDACIILKRMFPRVAMATRPPYFFQDSGKNAEDLAWFMMRFPLAMSVEDQDRLESNGQRYQQFQTHLSKILAPEYRPNPSAGFLPGKAMRDYQAQVVDVTLARGSLLCGDVIGLGKTYVGMGVAARQQAGYSLIVTEPHIQNQWQKKFIENTSLHVHPVTDRRADDGLPPADVYLLRYSNIAAWVDVLCSMQIGLICWDEIQKLRRGISSEMGKASMEVRKQSAHALGLTATPIYNYGREIYDVLSFIDDSILGTRDEFMREWTTDDGLLMDPEALGQHLRHETVFVRRTRKDVGRELPPPEVQLQYVDYDASVVESADALAEQLAITASTGSFTERGQATRDLDALMRHRTGVAKAKAVALFVRVLVEAGEKVVLAGWHRDVYEIWLRELRDLKPVMYTGSETAAQKERSKEAFINGEANIFILSLRSGAGTDGIQEVCSTVVIGELDWSPGIHKQIIGRVDRDRDDGLYNHALVFYALSKVGSDPIMQEVLGLKNSEATQIVDPGLGPQKVNDGKNSMKKLVKKYFEQAKARKRELASA